MIENRIALAVVLSFALGGPAVRAAAVAGAGWDEPPTAEQVKFFEAKIRPVLVDRCYNCHDGSGVKAIKGGLALDTREGLRRGGDSGPAIVPGDPDESLLIQAIRYSDEALQMPPKGKLPAAVIADFETWVRQGAADPREGRGPGQEQAAGAPTRKAMTAEEARGFWAFRAPRKAEPPAGRDQDWPRSPIDRFVLAGLEGQGLHPVGDAERHALIRRVTVDLTGLPPTPEEVRAFLADPEPTDRALVRVVDRLLGSDRFGERWGRHWLDVARFAESSGKEQNLLYPFAWRYRDYVIAAFNADKPYDQFLREQIAGDLLPGGSFAEQAERVIATGYFALGPKSHNTPNPPQFRYDLADEQIDAFSQGMLGMTIACARCHDHKFDPILQSDYYALAGIFLSTDTRFGTSPGLQNRQAAGLIALDANSGVPVGPHLSAAELKTVRDRLAELRKARQEILDEARAKRDPSIAQGNIRLIVLTTQIGLLEKRLSYHREDGTPRLMAMGLQDRLLPFDSPLLIRGELERPGEVLPRGLMGLLSASTPPAIRSGSGRLELASWVASADNPLTSRVLVNRVWSHLFGRGIVPTPDNFGTTGQPPSHPELLDWLAVSFVEDGWSVKSLIRRIVTSRTYQLASTYDAENAATDPDNRQLWRMSPRRLEAEAIRDAMLAASGELDLKPPVGSPVGQAGDGPVNLVRLSPAGAAFVVPPALFGAGPNGIGQPLRKGQGQGQGPGPLARALGAGALQAPVDPRYRSVYLPVIRDQIVDVLAAFDFAEPSLVTGARETTTVPSQALLLLNSPFALRQGAAMANRLLSQTGGADGRIRAAFEATLSRPPSDEEAQAARDFFEQFPTRAVKPMAGQGAGPGPGGPMGGGPVPPLLDPQRAAWTAFCQALFASAEFRYLP